MTLCHIYCFAIDLKKKHRREIIVTESQYSNTKLYRCRACRTRVKSNDTPTQCKVCGSDQWEYLSLFRSASNKRGSSQGDEETH
jgi:rubrerythrin